MNILDKYIFNKEYIKEIEKTIDYIESDTYVPKVFTLLKNTKIKLNEECRQIRNKFNEIKEED